MDTTWEWEEANPMNRVNAIRNWQGDWGGLIPEGGRGFYFSPKFVTWYKKTIVFSKESIMTPEKDGYLASDIRKIH
jgi:hypothetical protein